jgi:hypothetical protein
LHRNWENNGSLLKAKCENSSVDRAQPCQGWGREFESRFSLKIRKDAQVVELVDTLDLKSSDFTVVRVQVPPRVLFKC